jgi:transcriptional regulator with XRE-family HTH domain
MFTGGNTGGAHGDPQGNPHDGPQDSPRIGAQLRAARLAARKSMAEVAEQSGLTKGFLSKLERDLTNVSVASLIRLCGALEISVGSLFKAGKGEVVRKGEYPPINFGGNGVKEYLLTPTGEKRVQALLSDIEPGGGSGDEPYSLPADVEFVFILAGQLRLVVDGEHLTLDQGDAFTFPSSSQHTFAVPPEAGPAQVLWVFCPALPDGRDGAGGRRVHTACPAARRRDRRPAR